MNMLFLLLTSVVFTTSTDKIPFDKTIAAKVAFKDLEGALPDVNKMREALLFSYNAFELAPFRLKKETTALPNVTWELEPLKEGKATLTVGTVLFSNGESLETVPVEVEVLPPTALPDPYYLNNPLPLMRLDQEHAAALDEEAARALLKKEPFEEAGFPWKQLTALFVIMAFILGVRVLRRREKEEVVSKFRLDEMRAKFLSLEHPKILETEKILNNYLKEKIGIDATRKTTRERVLAITSAKTLKRGEKEALVHYFTLAERVKYGKKREAEEEIKIKKIGESLFSSN